MIETEPHRSRKYKRKPGNQHEQLSIKAGILQHIRQPILNDSLPFLRLKKKLNLKAR